MRKVCDNVVPRLEVSLGFLWPDSQQRRLSRRIDRVQEKIRCKKREFFNCGEWRQHQGNAPRYKSVLVIQYLAYVSIKSVPYPPYSPDLAP